ncbi:MAG TPA: hypothetical protein VMV41_01350 [Cellulomonadaceae bacterium]|nr:hypothetical protein [Cellulomonadaceae bacterium]
MIEPVTTGPATSDAAAPESAPTACDAHGTDAPQGTGAPQGTDAGASGADPRAGGHAEDAPRSLRSVELVADDEPIASNDEWDDPERL